MATKTKCAKRAKKAGITTLGQLTPDPRNARKHTPRNVGSIVDALHKVGAARSIVIDEHGVILAGNATVEAAGEAGIEKVQVVDADGETLIAVRRSGLTAKQKAELAILDNRAAELAEWNVPELQSLVQDFDISLPDIAFDDKEFTALGAGDPVEVTEDEVPTDAPARCNPGDLWLLGEHRLLCGDSTKAEDVAKLMNGHRAALCFTSPPYNLGASVGLRNGAFKGASTAYKGDADANSDQWLQLMREFTILALPVATSLAINVQMLSGNKRELAVWLGENANHLVDVLIWNKSNPQPAMAEHVASSAFEFVVILSAKMNPGRAIETAAFPRGEFSNVYTSSVGNNSHTNGDHGATFPVEFAGHYLRNLSKPSDVIFDPFLGSGTTIIAAEQLGRRCFGLEISPKYCDVIIARWERLTDKKATREGDF